MAKQTFSISLPLSLRDRLSSTARVQHQTQTSIVHEALAAWFERRESAVKSRASIVLEALEAGFQRREAANAAIAETIRRQVARVDARVNLVMAESRTLKEVVLHFVRAWLEQNPLIDEDLEESAITEARFQQFMDTVAQKLAAGGTIASPLLSFAREMDDRRAQADDTQAQAEARR